MYNRAEGVCFLGRAGGVGTRRERVVPVVVQRTSDGLRRDSDNVDMRAALRWGLPVSMLVAASLSVLSYTLSPAAEHLENSLYLAFFAAAFAGFLSARLITRWGLRASRVLCFVDALVLECAFAFFVLGYPLTQPPSLFTEAGVVMVAYSAASLLMLWLPYRPSNSVRAEMLGYALALFCGFLIRVLQSMLPPLVLGFAFPLAAAIPLFVVQKRCFLLERSSEVESPTWTIGDAVPLGALVVLAGFGMGLLGHGTYNADYSAGLLAVLIIAASFSQRHEALFVVSTIAPVLMVGGLCLWLLSAGAPFALYLAGCGLLTLYLLCRVRGGVSQICAVLCIATVLCIVGIVLRQVLAAVAPALLAVALIAALVVVEAVWRVCGAGSLPATASSAQGSFGAQVSPLQPLRHDEDGPTGAAEAEHALAPYRLSTREAEVASFLLENRSVGYICASLGLSQSTVKTHIRHIYEKANVHSKDELQLLAKRYEEERHPGKTIPEDNFILKI